MNDEEIVNFAQHGNKIFRILANYPRINKKAITVDSSKDINFDSQIMRFILDEAE
jgi:hypothetical protein